MSIEPFKKTKLQKRLIFWTSILALIAVVIIIILNPDKKQCQEMRRLLSQATQKDFYGVVREKKFDSELNLIISFKNSITSIQNIEIYNLIKNGDSIASDVNSSILKIYKPNKIITVDLKEIYFCDYSYYHTISKRWVGP